MSMGFTPRWRQRFEGTGVPWGCAKGNPNCSINCEFLGPLADLAFPIAALPGVLVGQVRGVTGQPRRLGVGLLGRIDVFLPVPEPLVLEVAEGGRPHPARQEVAHQDRLVEPCPQYVVENHKPQLVLVHADRLVVHLVVQPARGVVVARGVAGGHVEGHVQAAGDFVEDFLLELAVGRRRLLRLNLAKAPSAR